MLTRLPDKDRSEWKVLVCDLDETFLHTLVSLKVFPEEVDNLTQEERDRIYVINVDPTNIDSKPHRLFGVLRPHLDQTIDKFSQAFDILVVWSAATKSYVEECVKFIFSRHSTPILTLTRNDLFTPQGEKKYSKPLEKVAQCLGLPDTSNIVIIDDNSNVTRFDLMNRILIPQFKGDTLRELLDSKDDELLKVCCHLEKIIDEEPTLQCERLRELYENENF